MSIYYSGTLKRSQGIVSAIGKELKRINLKGVNRITVTFDPFAENVKSTRDFLFLLSTPRVVQTNPKCVVKTDVVCNRQPAEVKFSLIPSAQEQLKVKDVRFLSTNLNTLEILQLCNKHISSLAPEEEDTGKVLTKAEKQKIASAGKKAPKKK
ncbi:mitochondrial ribosomal protein L53 [Haematobia irritans]|uniref:Large ribosomal subunit protein mL53 n=1 Tax=Haematobia irritans TaxID=7368 RepID=A0A1L8EDJ6_HAEIR